MTKQVFDLIHKMQGDVHTVALAKGWWDQPRSVPECMCMIHSEISECYDSIIADDGGACVELADVLIRVMDMCEFHNEKLYIYYSEAHYERVDWVNPEQMICDLHSVLSGALEKWRGGDTLGLFCGLGVFARMLEHVSRSLDIDICAGVQMKHVINMNRPHRHGGKRC